MYVHALFSFLSFFLSFFYFWFIFNFLSFSNLYHVELVHEIPLAVMETPSLLVNLKYFLSSGRHSFCLISIWNHPILVFYGLLAVHFCRAASRRPLLCAAFEPASSWSPNSRVTRQTGFRSAARRPSTHFYKNCISVCLRKRFPLLWVLWCHSGDPCCVMYARGP